MQVLEKPPSKPIPKDSRLKDTTGKFFDPAFFTQKLYQVSMGISAGEGCRRTSSFNFAKMSIPEIVKSKLESYYHEKERQEAGLKLSSMVIHESLHEYLKKLESRRGRLFSSSGWGLLTAVKPHHFMAQADLGRFEAYMKGDPTASSHDDQSGTYGIAKEFREKLLQSYDQDYQDYQNRCVLLLQNAGCEQHEINEALPSFLIKFPTRAQIAGSLQIQVSMLEVPSIDSELEEMARLKETINRNQRADAEAEQIRIEAEFKAETLKSLREASYQAICHKQQEIVAAIEYGVENLRKATLQGRKLRDTVKKKVSADLRRLQDMAGIGSELETLIQQYAGAYRNQFNPQALESQLNEIDKFKEELSQNTEKVLDEIGRDVSQFDVNLSILENDLQSFGNGTNEVSIDDAWKQHQALKAKAETLMSALRTKRTDLVVRLEQSEKTIKQRMGLADGSFEFADEAVTHPEALEDLPNGAVATAEPYDSEAGF